MKLLMNYRFFTLILTILLTGCSIPTISPISQIDSFAQTQSVSPAPQPSRQVVKGKSPVEYLCQNKKSVKIQTIDKKTINVSFGQTSHKLSSTVSKNRKQYSNIRWIWSENFNGVGTLETNQHKVLAKNCVKSR